MTPTPSHEKAAAEIVGSLVLISIFVLAFAILAMVLFSMPAPQKVPAVAFSITNQSKIIKISHESGDSIPMSEVEILVDGVLYAFTCNDCGESWSIGETLTIDSSDHPDFPNKVDIVFLGTAQQLLTSMYLGTTTPTQTPVIIPTTPTPVTTATTPPVGAPAANFTGTPTSGTAPLTVVFTDTSTNTPTSWAWNFGDAGTSNSQNPTHTYTTSGTYTVTLTATNAGGSNTSIRTNYIVVTTVPPVAGFTGTPTFGTAPLTVVFTDTSTNTPTSWAWNFGDAGTSNSQNPTHIYTTSGTYTVALTATNAGGSTTATRVGYITVNAPITYSITESWSPGGLGYVSISVPTPLANPGTVSVIQGNSRTFSFVPSSNKKVTSYRIDGGATINPGTANGVTVTYTFTNVIANHTLVVTFG